MESRYYYNFSYKATGIAIILTAQATSMTDCTDHGSEISPGIFLAVRTEVLLPSEIRYLELGVRMMEDQIREVIQRNGPIVIEVLGAEFALTDYQEEGLACAMAGWIARSFGLVEPSVSITFNETSRLYEFSFPPLPG